MSRSENRGWPRPCPFFPPVLPVTGSTYQGRDCHCLLAGEVYHEDLCLGPPWVIQGFISGIVLSVLISHTDSNGSSSERGAPVTQL